jgi:hypothetical protein
MHADQHSAQAGLKSAPAMPQLTAFAPDAATYLIIPALQLPLSLLPTRHSAMLRTAAANAIGLVLVNVPATACATCIWFVTSKITMSWGSGRDIVIGSTRPVRAGWRRHSQSTHCAHAITDHCGSFTESPEHIPPSPFQSEGGPTESRHLTSIGGGCSAPYRTTTLRTGRGFGERLAVGSCGWHVGDGSAQPPLYPPPPEVIGSADLLVRDLLHLTLEAIEALSRPT